jgi:hypothetical protein
MSLYYFDKKKLHNLYSSRICYNTKTPGDYTTCFQHPSFLASSHGRRDCNTDGKIVIIIIIIGTTTLCGSCWTLKTFSIHPVLVPLFCSYPYPRSSNPSPYHPSTSFLVYLSSFSFPVLQALFFFFIISSFSLLITCPAHPSIFKFYLAWR